MATWKRFENEEPEFASKVRARFEAAETHVLATLRKDGSPRVSGSEVAFLGPDLSFGSMPDAVKARDLRRDGRCAIHAHPSADGDAKVTGVATEVTDPEEKRRYTTGSEPPGTFTRSVWISRRWCSPGSRATNSSSGSGAPAASGDRPAHVNTAWDVWC